ncbi:uncharacterized protein LOC124342840 isoform X1 [Daphnia pulicaria]|uniref:uncharacterized protein LOC124342840 isoform X1 n=1 Tax=Daphnia pulicaria TaxID=35523 RepID=UPI001EEC4B73|nr:uncharacterized protein LOC124342840 isoform X1 [Daphnia pulicaria]
MAKSTVNSPVILIKCTDESLIITTMCSFFKPKLSLDNMDLIYCISLLDSWIHSKKVIVFRWTSEDDNKTPYDFTDYSIPENCDGSKLIMKTGFILLHCDDVSKIALERDRAIMENIDQTKTRLSSKVKRSLCYPTMVPRPAGYTLDDEDENCGDDGVITDISQSQPQPSKKRTYAELDKENTELHSKIQKHFYRNEGACSGFGTHFEKFYSPTGLSVGLLVYS